MDDLRVEKRLGVGFNVVDHRTDEILRFTAPRGDKDVIATADVTEYDVLFDELFRVQFFPVIQRSHLVIKTHQGDPLQALRIPAEQVNLIE